MNNPLQQQQQQPHHHHQHCQASSPNDADSLSSSSKMSSSKQESVISTQSNSSFSKIETLEHKRNQTSELTITKNNITMSNNQANKEAQARDLIILTPYPVEPGHTLISVIRLNSNDWKAEMRQSASYIAEGDNAGIIINKQANIMDYNKNQAGQKERQKPPNAKMSFKVFLINSETGKLSLEHRTLRFWINQNISLTNNNNSKGTMIDEDDFKSTRTFSNIKQESSQMAQAYFCQLVGSKQDDFPKNYVAFIMKLMRLLKTSQFTRIIKMEVELRQMPIQEDQAKPPSRACKYNLRSCEQQWPPANSPFPRGRRGGREAEEI